MSKKKPIPPKEELESLYSQPGMSISKLARHYETSQPTARKWLIHYEIDRKSHAESSREVNSLKNKSLPDRDSFVQLHEKSSIKELESIYSVGQQTIYEWMETFGIDRPSLSDRCTMAKAKQFSEIVPTKKEFEEIYDRHKNLYLVAEEIGCSYSHVRSLVRRYDIETEKPWRSRGEDALFRAISEAVPEGDWRSNDKSIINPFELDIVSDHFKIAVEYCGSYWHSEGFAGKSKTYHKDKREKCLDKGYRLITVFEWDDMTKVVNLVRKMCGKVTRVYARECKARMLDSKEAADFNREHHLQGAVGASYHCGLFYQDELVMVLSMGIPRFKSKAEWECVRMTSHGDYQIVGGASKLFKTFRRHRSPISIITFADLRFGDGSVYDHCGFTREREALPNYWYFHKDRPDVGYSRVKFQKHKLKDALAEFDGNLTEYQNMKMNGWDRVWDCGNAVYVWEL